MLWKKIIVLVVGISSQCWKYGCSIPSFTNLAQHLQRLVNFYAASCCWSRCLAAQCISLANPPSSEEWFSWAAEKSFPPQPVSEMCVLGLWVLRVFGWMLGEMEKGAAAAFQSTNVGLSERLPRSGMEPDNGAHNTIQMHRIEALPTGVCRFLCNSSVLCFSSFGRLNVINMHFLNCCSEKWDPGAGGNISAAAVEWVGTSVSCGRCAHSYLNPVLVPEQSGRLFTGSSSPVLGMHVSEPPTKETREFL